MIAILFILGAAIGSFLNVVAMRYDPDKFLFANKVIGGRSHCPHCQRTLQWFELFPFFSFLFLRGRCRTCHKQLSLQYFIAELISGLLFAAVPFALHYSLLTTNYSLSLVLWILAFATLLLMSLIDMRTKLIPDEIHAILIVLGLVRIIAEGRNFVFGSTSFVSKYALLFGIQNGIWINHIAAALLGAGFFLALIAITRGRGMGMGDAKLGFALGLLFGWPDILFIVVFGFMTGAVFGVWKILRDRARMRSAVPFGPFLALGALIVFFWGNQILSWYFSLFGW